MRDDHDPDGSPLADRPAQGGKRRAPEPAETPRRRRRSMEGSGGVSVSDLVERHNGSRPNLQPVPPAQVRPAEIPSDPPRHSGEFPAPDADVTPSRSGRRRAAEEPEVRPSLADAFVGGSTGRRAIVEPELCPTGKRAKPEPTGKRAKSDSPATGRRAKPEVDTPRPILHAPIPADVAIQPGGHTQQNDAAPTGERRIPAAGQAEGRRRAQESQTGMRPVDPGRQTTRSAHHPASHPVAAPGDHSRSAHHSSGQQATRSSEASRPAMRPVTPQPADDHSRTAHSSEINRPTDHGRSLHSSEASRPAMRPVAAQPADDHSRSTHHSSETNRPAIAQPIRDHSQQASRPAMRPIAAQAPSDRGRQASGQPGDHGRPVHSSEASRPAMRPVTPQVSGEHGQPGTRPGPMPPMRRPADSSMTDLRPVSGPVRPGEASLTGMRPAGHTGEHPRPGAPGAPSRPIGWQEEARAESQPRRGDTGAHPAAPRPPHTGAYPVPAEPPRPALAEHVPSRPLDPAVSGRYPMPPSDVAQRLGGANPIDPSLSGRHPLPGDPRGQAGVGSGPRPLPGPNADPRHPAGDQRSHPGLPPNADPRIPAGPNGDPRALASSGPSGPAIPNGDPRTVAGQGPSGPAAPNGDPRALAGHGPNSDPRTPGLSGPAGPNSDQRSHPGLAPNNEPRHPAAPNGDPRTQAGPAPNGDPRTQAHLAPTGDPRALANPTPNAPRPFPETDADNVWQPDRLTGEAPRIPRQLPPGQSSMPPRPEEPERVALTPPVGASGEEIIGLTTEMEAIGEATQKRRRVDETLARFSKVHDELKAEEKARKSKFSKLNPWAAQDAELDEHLEELALLPGEQTVLVEPEPEPAGTRLQEKKVRKQTKSTKTAKIFVGTMAVLIFLATGIGWGFKKVTSDSIGQVRALDPDSASIQNAEGQRGDENFLLIGSDSRDGAASEDGVGDAAGVPGARSDTIMVAHIPADRSRVVVVSFPRDLEINRPNCERFDPKTFAYTGETAEGHKTAKMNTAYQFGGPLCITKVVQEISGLKITRFIGIDFNGFKGMVDAVDGVNVCVEKPMYDTTLNKWIVKDAGKDVELRGDQALDFVRARHVRGDVTSDYGRIIRQQRFLSSLLRKAMSAQVLLDPGKLTSFASSFAESTFGDNINIDALLHLGQSMQGLEAGRVTFITVPTVGEHNTRGNETLLKEPTAALFRAIINDQPLPGEKPAAPPPAAGSPQALPQSAPLRQAQPVDPKSLKIQVLNGGNTTDGIAGRTANELGKFGYTVVNINAGPTVPKTVVRYGKGNEAAAQTLASSVPGAVLEESAANGTALVLILGPEFKGKVNAPTGTVTQPEPEKLPANLSTVNGGDVSCA
ncbi:LCP family glycopolymer transferase [Actinokineospora sp. HUAS TT18]|uniref:LCP family protein n=1 Tax=Actinokineospora sp. HUAS TT18 TaxID=3447451 RepID=UPI003F521FFF